MANERSFFPHKEGWERKPQAVRDQGNTAGYTSPLFLGRRY